MEQFIARELIDYGTLGVFLIFVILALYMTVRFIIKTFNQRMEEFNEREKNCEKRVTDITDRLNDYIDHDHRALIEAIKEHSNAYQAQTRTLEILIQKLVG